MEETNKNCAKKARVNSTPNTSLARQQPYQHASANQYAHRYAESSSSKVRSVSSRDETYSPPAKRSRYDYDTPHSWCFSSLVQLTQELNQFAKQVEHTPNPSTAQTTLFIQRTNTFCEKLQQLLSQAKEQNQTGFPGYCLTSISSLSKLAKAGYLNTTFPIVLVNYCFENRALQRDKLECNISTYFYGLGVLAEQEKLNGSISNDKITLLLTQLQGTNAKSQEISNSLYALGLLARAKRLEGTINNATPNTLLTQLCGNDVASQHISNSLHGLGQLAEAGQLECSIDSSAVNTLLTPSCCIYPQRL